MDQRRRGLARPRNEVGLGIEDKSVRNFWSYLIPEFEAYMTSSAELIAANLLLILEEIRSQPEVGKAMPAELLSYEGQVERCRKWIEDAGEYGIAYEALVSMLEEFPFKLSGSAAIRLLEVGLLMKFKTEQPEDTQFDSR